MEKLGGLGFPRFTLSRRRISSLAAAKARQLELENAKRGGIVLDLKRRYDEALITEFAKSHCVNLRPSARIDLLTQLRRALPHLEGTLLAAITPAKLDEYRDQEAVAIRQRLIDFNARSVARFERRAEFRRRRGGDTTLLERRIAHLRERGQQLQRSGPRSVNKSLSAMRTFFKWAAARGYMVTNPAALVRKLKAQALNDAPREELIYSLSELERLFAAADPGLARTLLKVLAFTGVRLGEALGLQWGDLQFAGNTVLIRRQLCVKSGVLGEPKTDAALRMIEVPRAVMAALKEWKLACPKGELELVFPDSDGGPLDQANFRNRRYGPAVRRAGLRRLPLHNLRHGYASMLIATGADIAAVSKVMGHSKITVTLNCYTHFFQARGNTGLGARLEAFLAQETGQSPTGTG